MAGLAGLMTRKKRDRRRELELKLQKQETGSFTEMRLPLTGKEAQEALQRKAAHESIKKILGGKELLHQKSKSFDGLSQVSHLDDDDSSGEPNPYSLVYIGLVFVCMGIVMTFVGLGDKGFKTLQLKLVGPILCLIGLAFIAVKILHCTFPEMFKIPQFIINAKERKNTAKLRDAADKSNLMEKAAVNNQNGHLSNNEASINKDASEILSPRVTLQSAKPVLPRPQSTIPNYIEISSDEDDFNHSTNRNTNYYNNKQNYNVIIANDTTPMSSNNKQFTVQQSIINNTTSNETRHTVVSTGGNKMTSIHKKTAGSGEDNGKDKNEIVLTPKGLML